MLKILVVDDDEKIRLLLERLLSMQENYEATFCKNGREALVEYEKNRHALILSDLMMPEMDGFELCRAIRALPGGDQPIIIMITAYGSPDILEQILAAGADDYITKPLRVQLLQARLTVATRRFKDRAQRFKAEEQLRRLEKAVESMNAGVTITDINNKIIYVNSAEAKMHGYTTDELKGQDVGIYVPAQFRKYLTPPQMKEIKHWVREGINIRKDGTTFPVLLTSDVVKNEVGEPVGMVTICEELTTKKQAENVLQTNLNFLDILIDTIPSPVFYKDKDGLYRGCNRAFEVAIGVEEKDMIGKTVYEVSPHQLAKVYHQKDMDLLETGGIQVYETNVRFADNSIRDVIFYKATYPDHENRVAGIVGILHDISDLREAERKLRESNADKDKFFSIISHDLKTPLTAFLVSARTLDEELEHMDFKQVNNSVSAIRDSAERLWNLLENLLEWSRLQLNRIEFEPEELNLRMTIIHNFMLLQEFAAAKKIQLIENAPPSCIIYADKYMIETILRNLISNAIKFTEVGGMVTIETHCKDDFVKVAVTDTGVGISEDDIKKLFRIDIAYKRDGTSGEKGTGLGLILCKELVEKNGGKIWVESEIGQGSTFYFTIPKA